MIPHIFISDTASIHHSSIHFQAAQASLWNLPASLSPSKKKNWKVIERNYLWNLCITYVHIIIFVWSGECVCVHVARVVYLVRFLDATPLIFFCSWKFQNWTDDNHQQHLFCGFPPTKTKVIRGEFLSRSFFLYRSPKQPETQGKNETLQINMKECLKPCI